MTKKNDRMVELCLLICLLLSGLAYLAVADPTGAEITFNSTGSAPSTTPANRSDARGTVTTLILSVTQQDQSWKAYVGNVSGALTLDDADGYTIYDWDLTGVTISGEVYAMRTNSPDFSSVICANAGNISEEETFHNMTGSEVDSISNTFNYTEHSAFFVGTNSISADSCSSTATYVNDSLQNMADADNFFFEEVILQDNANNVMFVTLIEDNVNGYTLNNDTYDFQMIIPESDIKSSPTTYYFFTEISS